MKRLIKDKFLSYKDEKIDNLLNNIIEVIKNDVNPPFKIYLFGSFATDKATYFSDIDIALETKEVLTKRNLIKLKENLENIKTLRKIDFIYINNASKNLKETVKKEGILIYELE